MKILITGGAGFIGSNLCRQLYKEKHEVTVLDALTPQIHGPKGDSELLQSIRGTAEFIHGDVRDGALLKTLVHNQDIVIHLAAETGTGQSMYEMQKYTDTNVNGTACLLEAVASHGLSVKKILLSSSRAVYGEGKYRCPVHGSVYPQSRREEDMAEKDFEAKCPVCGQTAEVLPTDELSAIQPGSIYAATKYAQEQLVSLFCRTTGIPGIIFRYQNVYGSGQSLNNPYTGILSIFSGLLRRGEDINIFEDGRESRDFVFIDDVVAATILGLNTTGQGVEVFNVGSGRFETVLDAAKILKQAFQSNSALTVSGNFRKGDIRHNIADLAKVRSKLGFEPKVTFADGVKKFVSWVLAQPAAGSRYQDSLKELKDKGLLK